MECSSPDTCTCIEGWEGVDCLSGIYIIIIILLNIIIILYCKALIFFILLAICNLACTTNMECTSPNTCTCIEGWEGADCLSGILFYDAVTVCTVVVITWFNLT